jgi:hypothetical protein
MARRKKEKRTFHYECSLTGDSYVVTASAPNPENLMSVKAYYELNPDKDDRPLKIKKELGLLEKQDS